MSSASLTAAERASALMAFGYSTEEAAFLAMAALHGGYFLRRQAATYFGCRDGATVTRLSERLLSLEQARSSTWRHRTELYHICARPFYDAIGEPNNRNRRAHAWDQIKNRIMGLDFALAHRNAQFLLTAQEKADYFSRVWQATADRLPVKRYHSTNGRAVTITLRFFVDNYPIFLPPNPNPASPSHPTFCFVDEGLVGLSRFETYLAQYRRLFETLPAFHLVYVADRATHFAGARALFERFRGGNATPLKRVSSHDPEKLLTYFRLRRDYENHHRNHFDRAQLIQLRDARAAFSSPEVETLYAGWVNSGEAELGGKPNAESKAFAPVAGTISTEQLTHDYDLFDHTWPR